MHDMIIRGGLVYDGTGADPVKADIAIDGDRVSAVVHVERKSQKGIVIGKQGRTVKAISSAARARISELTGRPCDLYLDVRVTENWTRDPKKLEALGYHVIRDEYKEYEIQAAKGSPKKVRPQNSALIIASAKTNSIW